MLRTNDLPLLSRSLKVRFCCITIPTSSLPGGISPPLNSGSSSWSADVLLEVERCARGAPRSDDNHAGYRPAY